MTEILELTDEVGASPESQNTFAAKLRKLADWIDDNEIGDGEIVMAGVEIGGQARICTRGHDILKVCFPGRSATMERGENADLLILNEDCIRFEGWKLRERAIPETQEVTL